MKWDNEFYGHRAVLGDFVGWVGEAPPIWGYLQHGWHWGTGFPARYRFLPGFSLFVWTSANAAQAAARRRPVVAIGAPFLYLMRAAASATETAPARPPGRGTIFYPFHTAPGQPTFGSHDDLLAEVAGREPGQVTVCLYWMDHADEGLRRRYEGAGFRVVCHGHRSDPQFLRRQHAELSDHRRVITNRVSTALWYGAALGLEAEVYGPHFGQTATDDGTAFDRFQRSRWPELFGAPLAGEEARVRGAVELGAANLREAEELVSLLGWTGARLRLGGPIKRGIEARRRIIARVRTRGDTLLPPDRPPVDAP